MPISEFRFLEFQEETKKDKILQHQIIKEWSLNTNEVDESILPYFNIRVELAIYEGIVMKGNHIIVPMNMRKEMKQLLHTSHIGITKITARARKTLYWPGISSELNTWYRHAVHVRNTRMSSQKKLCYIMISQIFFGLKWAQMCSTYSIRNT